MKDTLPIFTQSSFDNTDVMQQDRAASLLSGTFVYADVISKSQHANTTAYEKITCELWVGVDVGSTTVKIAVVDPLERKLLYWNYVRHSSRQAEMVRTLLSSAHEIFPRAVFKTSICGSGAEPIAEIIGGHFVQEVIANSIAVSELFPQAKTSIELGGQDAKILFFTTDEKTGRPRLSDMRMNGCCAGGTGAFIDQVAVLLNIPIEKFDAAAQNGTNVFDISGRCGVFAKTDLQPLLNMGAAKEDLALSVFHAVAKQTITGLGHGMQLNAPVVFLGGPFSFNRSLVSVFAKHLNLSSNEILVPPCPQVTVAIGAALAVGILPHEPHKQYRGKDHLHGLLDENRVFVSDLLPATPLFHSREERESFRLRHATTPFVPKTIPAHTVQDVYIGIDSGSTTVKFVLVDKNDDVVDTFYSSNSGDPLGVVRKALLDIYDSYRAKDVTLNVLGIGATGYGESLVAKAFCADFHTVETIAHAHAAMRVAPDATFVLDLGGQDMKAMRIKNGVICDLYLNEACSAGCGSFIETLATSLGIPIEQVATRAFSAQNPSKLGSRCTVFMNSSITTEQKNGKSIEDIIAGLCCSVVDNLFTKVIRDRNASYLGDTIVVQGGTFKNDAVLRAFELHTNARVIRPRHAGEMGALGVALLTKDSVVSAGAPSTFIGFDALRSFETTGVTHDMCTGCANNCKRTIVRFSNGARFCAGNRCEKGNVETKAAGSQKSISRAASLSRFRNVALFKNYPVAKTEARKEIIGIPRILEFYNSLPFWKTLFSALGYQVVLSPQSTNALHQKGLRYVASDNICFPAKIAHGHIEYLMEQKVDRIFMPIMSAVPSTLFDAAAVHTCPVLQGYPFVLTEMNRPYERMSIAVDAPAFQWHDDGMRNSQVERFLRETYSLPARDVRRAIMQADHALLQFRHSMKAEGARVLAETESQKSMAMIMTGRPYHHDPFINHGVPDVFSELGIPLFTVDSLPEIDKIDLSRVRPDLYNPFHSEVYAAALFAAAHPLLEVVQLVSFGCGHDAIISDELCRIMNETCGKQPLVLKVDEGEALGALGIRIRSFVETLKRRRT